MFSQDRIDYYVVLRPNNNYDPVQTILNSDETLDFEMVNPNVESFLNSVPIFSLQKAFPTAGLSYLQRTYRISLDSNTYIDTFFSRQEIEYVEIIEEEETPLYIPNDYEYLDRDSPNTALEIIKDPLAWNITQGNPDIMVGILDAGFLTNHEDIKNKILLDLGRGQHFHGTLVASGAAGQTDNNVGLSSIGFDTNIAIRSGGGYNGALLLSQQPGVRVINISFKFGCTFSPVANEVFSEIWNGTGGFPPVVVVAAAGNGKVHQNAGGFGYCLDSNGEANGYVYPAAYDNVISVSGVNHLVPRGTEDFELGFGISWEDLALSDINNPNSTLTNNDDVDLCVLGHNLLAAIDDSDGYSYSYGTSIASPIVAGTAALMLAVNPNLTPNEIRDILKSTTDYIYDIPENAPFTNRYGTGRLNAFRAVKMAQCSLNSNPGLDLAMQNYSEDTFQEPDTATEYVWRSEDIWARNQDDGRDVRFHQNPEYSTTEPNYVYVNVTNNSCQTSDGTDDLVLYWAKANTELTWPLHWTGNHTITDPTNDEDILMGDEIGTLSIPVLQPGQSKLVKFEWNVPNPEDYENINDNPWHFCLLARINTHNDLMTFPEGSAITENVANNNNIVWENLTVSPSVTKTYTLEIISDIDGYKDYDDVEVAVNPYKIESIVPNPASNIVTINYLADDANSAYLMVVGTQNNTSNNYILDNLQTSISLIMKMEFMQSA